MNLNKEMENSKDFLIKSYLQSNCTSRCIPLKPFLDNIEKEMIVKALKISRGNQRVASLILGLKPSTLNEKIKKFKLNEKKKISTPKELRDYLNQSEILSI